MQEENLADNGSNAALETTSVEVSPAPKDTEVSNTETSEEPIGKAPETESSNDSDNLDETVEGAMNEVKSEKGKNRVHELAQRARQRELDAQQRETQIQQAEAYTQQQVPADVRQQVELMQTELNIQRAERELQAERMAFDKVLQKYPEIGEDPQLDDMVYSKYRAEKLAGRSVDLETVARETVQWYKGVQSKMYENAEKGIQQKEVTTEKRATSTEVYTDSPDKAVKQAYDRFLKTRDQQAYQDYLSAKRKAQG